MTDSEVSAAERLRVATAALAAIAVYQGGKADEPWRVTVETAERMDGWFREAVAERDAAYAEQWSPEGRGRCGEHPDQMLSRTAVLVCELPAGHPGWHREGATEWTGGWSPPDESHSRPVAWPDGSTMADECICTIRRGVFLANPDCAHHGVVKFDETATLHADRDRLAAELADLRRSVAVWATRVRMLAAHSVPSPTASAAAAEMADDMDAAVAAADTSGLADPEANGRAVP